MSEFPLFNNISSPGDSFPSESLDPQFPSRVSSVQNLNFPPDYESDFSFYQLPPIPQRNIENFPPFDTTAGFPPNFPSDFPPEQFPSPAVELPDIRAMSDFFGFRVAESSNSPELCESKISRSQPVSDQNSENFLQRPVKISSLAFSSHFACINCRSSKTRCELSNVGDRICKRCAKRRSTCRWRTAEEIETAKREIAINRKRKAEEFAVRSNLTR